ncbi:hypothetical protein PVAG01_00462 [Phlyctema vagabunda]|uniref:Uncharacterized protein n=1 Tax=Phlyctema vagabunda TaxID=108571 RepID=A0ABR4PUR9_9HELO
MQFVALLFALFCLSHRGFSHPTTTGLLLNRQHPDGLTICHPPPFTQDTKLCALGFQATQDPERVSLFLYDNMCVQIGEEIDIPAKMHHMSFQFAQLAHPITLSTVKSSNGGGQYLLYFRYNGQRWGVNGKDVSGFGRFRETLSPAFLDTIEIKFTCEVGILILV